MFEQVRSDYVEKPDDSKLVESAISGMLTGLDPHSSYMDARASATCGADPRRIRRLGIEVTMEDGLIKVVSPIDDTPASRPASCPTTSSPISTTKPCRASPSTRPSKDARSGQHQDPPEDHPQGSGQSDRRHAGSRQHPRPLGRARTEGDDIGYIRITTFNEQTTEGLKREIANQTQQLGDKLKGFIIDLRNNPGGLLEEAVTVSDAFLERGEIVSTRGRNAEETQRRAAHPGDLTKGKPIIVLINGGSASASEIVAGALQDHKRATLVGTRSFGKGSVQTIIPLSSGNGALRLTTARYFTPSGKSIQAKGIVPDIEVLQDVPDELKSRTDTKGEASLRGHLKSEGDEKTGRNPARRTPRTTRP